MLIDSHAHLNFVAFESDLDEVIKRCQEKPMKVVNVGSQLASSFEAVKIAEMYKNMFATVSIHPIHLGESEKDLMEQKEHEDFLENGAQESFKQLAELARNKKVVAIGETGLDYYRLSENKEEAKKIQKEYFSKFIGLAQDLNLPIILHGRGTMEDPYGAYEEILDMIKDKKLCGVIHCFGANLEIAQKFVDLGFYVGFTGVITFKKKAEELQKVVKALPIEKILIETDSPYLAPEPYRGKRNEPVYVELVAKKIAELKGMTIGEVIEETGKNAEKLFKI